MRQPSTWALQKAAQAWCSEQTKGIVMDALLCTEFARIIDDLVPHLGLATTRQMLMEILARSEIHGWGNYRTVDSEE